MLIKDVQALSEFVAGDRSLLREILHPDRDDAAISYSLAEAVVRPGRSTLPHRLTSSEVYYIVAGAGAMHVDDESEQVHAGNAVVIPPGSTQWIENTGGIDLVFLCIVEPAWRAEQEEVVE
jgi:mannose-6-phosphate isomerase-like protein (cupin superfamily)